MKKSILLLLSLLLLVYTGCSDSDNSVDPGGSSGLSGNTEIIESREVLFQVSTIDALLLGLYDGEMDFASLGLYGDFGLGTVDELDGELVVLDGVPYKIRDDGVAYVVDDASSTPFAAVTDFDTDVSFSGTFSSFDDLTAFVDSKLATNNIFYAIKITGTFEYVKTRSVPKQAKPYPPLTEVVKDQSVFELEQVEGTVVGFRCPPYVEGVNVPGYHLHFLTKDKKAGGHILDIRATDVTIEMDLTHAFELYLPDSDEFYSVALDGDQQDDLEEVEQD